MFFFWEEKNLCAFSDVNWETIFSTDLGDMQLKTVKYACTQNPAEGWAGDVTTLLTWLDNLMAFLTASVHNLLTLNKLKVPLCNLTPEPRRVRWRVGATRVLLHQWRGLQNHSRAVRNAAPNTDGASRAQLCKSPWFVRNHISQAALSRSHQLLRAFFSQVSGWWDGFPR